MQIDFEIDVDNFLVAVNLSGNFDFTTFETFYSELMECPKWQMDMAIIWDACKLNVGSITKEQLREMGAFIQKFNDKRGIGKAAWVTNDDLGYGLARMFEMMNESRLSITFCVFRTLDEAKKWMNNP